jgi:hypothetical protein
VQPEGKSIAPVHFGLLGSIPRQGKERVVTMGLNADGSLLACQGADKTVEMYHVRSDEEVKKKLKRRAKRLKEKARAHSNGMAMCLELYDSARLRSFFFLKKKKRTRWLASSIHRGMAD